jgi:hypothetical protein
MCYDTFVKKNRQKQRKTIALYIFRGWEQMNNKQHCVPFVLYLFLRRKNKHLDDYTCVLCTNGHEETSFHLFFECPFSVTVGAPLLQPLDMIIQARRDFGSHIFTEIFITTCWTIWNARNGFIFL